MTDSFLREQEDFSTIPILMISVVERIKLQEISDKYGISFLQKPVSRDDLMNKLREIL